ncbi:MAG: hypothetical protein IJW79_00250 [Clostridia bacterium]|nr:hypothetical protein [Clostridia bacterium]
MANNLYNQFGSAPVSNEMAQIVKQVQDFQKTFKGDAKAQVEQMVASGIIPQSVFNELAQQANQIMAFMPK